MPDYDMVCTACSHGFELTQSIHKALPVVCPKCKRHTLSQDYSKKNMVYLDMTPTTIGQQAERNEKNTTEKYEQWVEKKRAAKQAKEDATPWWRDKDEGVLDMNKVKDVKKYVETGETC